MKLFMTGATGFLGKEVANAAIAAGHDVRALVRDPGRGLDHLDVVEGSLNDSDAVKEGLQGCQGILHLAGKVSRNPDDASAMHEVHVEGTSKLLDAAEAAGVHRIVVASTSGTIAVSAENVGPMDEAHRPDFEVVGQWPYYTSKHLQEREVLRRHEDGRIDAVLLNPSLLLGPGDDRISSTGDVLDILHRRVPALTKGTVAFIDVRDAAPCFIEALRKGKGGRRYLLSGANMRLRTFVERVALTGGVRVPKIELPKKWAIRSSKILDGVWGALGAEAPVDPVSVEMGSHFWDCDSRRAESELGLATRDPQTTISDTVRYLSDRGLFRA